MSEKTIREKIWECRLLDEVEIELKNGQKYKGNVRLLKFVCAHECDYFIELCNLKTKISVGGWIVENSIKTIKIIKRYLLV